jgi:lipoyl synthase
MKNRLPAWFRQEIPDTALIKERNKLFRGLQLNTVCESANCPNIYDCFKRHTATFLILGKVCTRDCRFCAVEKGLPAEALVAGEPENIAAAVRKLGLKYVVITSVTRDDLEDAGAGQFALTVNHLQAALPEIKIEVLIPDFQGKGKSLETVVKSCPQVMAHNLETVPRLYPQVRSQADYARSLELLRRIKELGASIITKSGIMVGLGEEEEEIVAVIEDLRKADCDILTIGQYLQPSPAHLPVKRFLTPAQFQKLGQLACSLGFKQVSCGPLVRSSYHSQEIFRQCTI